MAGMESPLIRSAAGREAVPFKFDRRVVDGLLNAPRPVDGAHWK
jgi:hypothetical protein